MPEAVSAFLAGIGHGADREGAAVVKGRFVAAVLGAPHRGAAQDARAALSPAPALRAAFIRHDLVGERIGEALMQPARRAVRFASWLSHHPALGQQRMLMLSRPSWWARSAVPDHRRGEHDAAGEVIMKTACGTPGYVAPEVLGHEAYSSQVWAQ